MPKKFVAQQGALGTGKMVRLRNVCGSLSGKTLSGSVRCSRHRQDGVPKKLCGSVRWSRHRKDGVPNRILCSGRWPGHRKDGVPKTLVFSNAL